MKQYKILVIDDEVDLTKTLSKRLSAEGYDVLIADSGEEALEKLNMEHPCDLVLLDIVMPGIDGYAVLKEIRLSAHTKNLPVIAVTARPSSKDEKICLDMGANDYLPRPYDSRVLIEKIRALLKKSTP